MKKSTKQVVWGILCLFALAGTIVIGIGRHYPSPDSIFATHGSVQLGVSLIGAAVALLSVWLWMSRGTVAKVPLASSEANEIFEAISESFRRRSAISLEDFQASLVSARRNVGVAEAVLNHIRMHMGLWGDGRVAIGTAKDVFLMKWVIEHEYVPKDDIAKAVHERLCEIGRSVYEWHIVAPLIRYPDHSISPEALGYAILHGVVSTEEAGNIRFDHGETAEEYSKAAEKLYESVMRQLGGGDTYFSAPKPEGDGGSFPCCA